MSGRLYLDEIYSKNGQTKVLDTTSFDANNNFEASNTGFNLNYQSANAALNIVQSGTGDALRVNSNSLVVDSSGNVGIGVNPVDRLSIKNSTGNGTLDIKTGTVTADSVRIQSGGSVTNYLEYRGFLGHVWFVDTTERMRIDSSGNVGIGTSTPSYKLDITGPGTAGASTLRLNDAASVADSKHLLLTRGSTTAYVGIAGSQTNDPLIISRSGNYDLNIDSSGNVGIGTSSPSEELEIRKDNATIYINGGASAYELTSTLKFTRAKIETAIQSGTANGDTRMEFHTRTSGIEAERMRIDSSGSIKFGNNGNIGIIGATGGDVFTLYQNRNGSTPYFYFNTSGGYGVYSDARLKENITSLSKEDATNLIKNINPVEFNWKSDFGDNTKRISGVLAQDVLAYATTEGQKNILTHWETFDESDPDCPHMGLSDHRLIPSIIGTIQHLLDELDEKTSQIEALTTRIETLESNTTP